MTMAARRSIQRQDPRQGCGMVVGCLGFVTTIGHEEKAVPKGPSVKERVCLNLILGAGGFRV